MTNIKSAIKNSILPKEEEIKIRDLNVELENKTQNSATKKKEKKKRRRGRPSKVHRTTKLHTILESRGMTRKDLYDLIAEKYPYEAVSPDAVSRIVSGSRRYYSTTTLFRICGALQITPNMALNWEEEVV
tara:strand:+ start:622 stop:1011 length:390 start_codon:yes stop_codon:yes gene_type:complete